MELEGKFDARGYLSENIGREEFRIRDIWLKRTLIVWFLLWVSVNFCTLERFFNDRDKFIHISTWPLIGHSVRIFRGYIDGEFPAFEGYLIFTILLSTLLTVITIGILKVFKIKYIQSLYTE